MPSDHIIFAGVELSSGRKPVICKSRHSVANFKLRKDQAIGCRVTLRRDAMYEFFDRMIATALPRIRDFRGLSTRSFDGRGNYSLGVAEQTIFPEIDLDKIEENARSLTSQCAEHGIEVVGVTKVTCGMPHVARAGLGKCELLLY